MSYTALYRKKRPQHFGNVVGQPHVVRTLTNQLNAGNISHAYLFCGTRGTGKTSVAKIFARAVNCTEANKPCNVCETCQAILAERNLNVIEIDAASNNGVDNIRDLRDEVQYPPTEGNYKVYIIDEAHMLTTAAFNALLKTLEEPPPHVMFILATTDPQKIPATILSRCQRYDFKRISTVDMVETLLSYMKAEGVEAEESALRYIASVSDGAMRDALSVLDQCLSLYGEEELTLQKVQSLLGAVDRKALFEYAEALKNFDTAAALEIISTVSKEGRDLSRFAADMIVHFRNILVAVHVSPDAGILDYSPEQILRFHTQGKDMEHETIIGYIRAFSELQNELRYSSHERMALEVCTIKLCNPLSEDRIETVFARLTKLEQTVEGGGYLATVSTANIPSTTNATNMMNIANPPKIENIRKNIEKSEENKENKEIKENKSNEIIPNEINSDVISVATTMTSVSNTESDNDPLSTIPARWRDFCGQLSMLLKPMLSMCTVSVENGVLTIICGDIGSLNHVKNQQAQINEGLVKYFRLAEAPPLNFVIKEETPADTESFRKNISAQINMPIEFE